MTSLCAVLVVANLTENKLYLTPNWPNACTVTQFINFIPDSIFRTCIAFSKFAI